jgi:hypothetical protein
MIPERKKNPTKRDILLFALSLVLFFGALGGLVMWQPEALIGGAILMASAWLISLIVNRNEWHLQVLGVFLPLIFFVIGGSLQAGANPLGVAITTWVVGASVGTISIMWLKLGRLAYAGWMLAVFPIGWTMSHLILGMTFYLLFTPIGLAMRLFGWDPMRRSYDPKATTYWVERKPPTDTSRYFQQF